MPGGLAEIEDCLVNSCMCEIEESEEDDESSEEADEDVDSESTP